MLAEALKPILNEEKLKQIVKDNFKKHVDKYYMDKMHQKV